MINKQKFKLKKRELIAEITLSGICLALVVIFRAIFKYIDVLNGYSLQVQMIFFCLSLYLLRTWYFKIGFFFLTPLLLLLFGINGHIFFDYLLPYWGFFAFLFLQPIINKINFKNQIKTATILISLTIIFNLFGYFVMFFSYVLSGIYFYKVNFNAAVVINGPIVLFSAIINIIIISFTIYPLKLMQTKINKNIYY